MNILFVAPRYHTNQVGVVMALKQMGHNVHFLVSTKGSTENYKQLKPLLLAESRIGKILQSLFGKPGDNKKWYLPGLRVFASIFADVKPSLVIIRFHGIIFPLVAYLWAVYKNIPVVVYQQIESSELNLESGFTLKKGRKAMPRIMSLLFGGIHMTPLRSRGARYAYMPEHSHYLPFVVAEGKTAADVKKSRPKQILMIGKFMRRKQHLLILDAVHALVKHFDIKLTIVGEVSTQAHEVYFDKVNGKVKQLGITDAVTLVRNAPNETIEAFYASHDLFVLPASDEPASVSVLEALAYGLPVICSDTCGTKTYIEEGRNGCVFDSGNVLSLIEKIKYIIEDRDRFKRMSSNALTCARRSISAETYHRSFHEMMGDALMPELRSEYLAV